MGEPFALPKVGMKHDGRIMERTESVLGSISNSHVTAGPPGFKEPTLHWYHFHPAPPMLEPQLGARFREEASKLEFSTSWRGHFLASAFVVEAIAG